ncbi:MAG: AmmeMemoRadiSam system protein A [Candidatus Altiarchaeota archaeon]|nr:AmmeMemoRadiSam system protein A [Candidatus Altiarchaeota archaeon]
MDGKILVNQVRKIINAYFDKTHYEPAIDGAGGAFVTLLDKGELRGCIGIPVSDNLKFSLNQAAIGVLNDPRFPPVKKSELAKLTIEVSVLSPPEPVKDPLNEIKLGKHGIIVKKGFHSGLLLPQVPVEQGWSLTEYLDYGCIKAGLTAGCWKKKAQLSKFTAHVFSEKTPGGKVIEKLS